MSPFDRDKARRGLEVCLRRLRDVAPRFAESPARAVGYFLEGPGEPLNTAFFAPDMAAHFLRIPRERVVMAQQVSFSTPPMTHSGPYCDFLRDDGVVETAAATASLRRQLDALRPTFTALEETLQSAPAGATAGRLPARVSSWWEALFHLAVHYPTTFLGAVRMRWPAAAEGQGTRAALPYLAERFLRFHGGQVPVADVVPGVIWVGLEDDVFASTESAIESLLGHLTPPPARPSEPGVFADLSARFEHAGRCVPHCAGTPTYPVPRLVKFASTFETGPTADWCDYPMRTACSKLLLSRCHGEAEYLLYRGTSSEDEESWAAAGTALPDAIADEAVMFSSAARNEHGGYDMGVQCGQPFLNPEPAARWVRFVFNTLRGDGVDVRFRPIGSAPAGTALPLYGDAVLDCDFHMASARAIKKAGLLDGVVTVAVPTIPAPPPEPPDGPFEPFGFRYRGREADFAAAPLRHTLLVVHLSRPWP